LATIEATVVMASASMRCSRRGSNRAIFFNCAASGETFRMRSNVFELALNSSLISSLLSFVYVTV
jgi:hypothetical protein